MRTIDEAHRYADAGIYVIPIAAKSKRPAIKTGPEHRSAATINHNVIDAWYTAHPEWGVAIVCTPSKLVVIDIDGPEGGETFDKLRNLYGDPPNTWEAETANGRHLIYRWPGGTPIRTTVAGPKLDIRGAGSYIVAPPSTHPTGRPYEWVRTGGPIADAPAWLTAGRSDPVNEHDNRHAGQRSFDITVTPEMWDGLWQKLAATGNTRAAAWIERSPVKEQL